MWYSRFRNILYFHVLVFINEDIKVEDMLHCKFTEHCLQVDYWLSLRSTGPLFLDVEEICHAKSTFVGVLSQTIYPFHWSILENHPFKFTLHMEFMLTMNQPGANKWYRDIVYCGVCWQPVTWKSCQRFHFGSNEKDWVWKSNLVQMDKIITG